MNILLTNDDGIESPGIQVLAKRLEEEHNVFVVAPDSNRSAVSNHITIFNNLKIYKYGKNQWACSGFPCDCAEVGLASNLCGVHFDLCISGINKGPNLGTDIVYSGTCSAARQSVFNGVPSFALSVDPVDWNLPVKYEAMADFAAKNLETLIKLTSIEYPRIFLNINGDSLDSYKGVKFGDELCVRGYRDHYEIEEKEGCLEASIATGSGENHYGALTDYSIVKDGYICVNRVYADPLCAKIVEGLTFKL